MPPLTAKGAKVKKSMEKSYGKDKGEEVFYKSVRGGTIKGAEKKWEKKGGSKKGGKKK
jgi:hypothetical protein